MKTKCPHCGQHYEVEDCTVGTTVTCENCWKDFTVSDAAAAPPPPAAAKPASEPTISRCPFCGGDIAPGVKKCRHCGEWLDSSARPKNPVVFVLLGIFGWFMGAHMFYAFRNNAVVFGVIHCVITWGSVLLFSFFRFRDAGGFAILLLAVNFIYSLCELIACDKHVGLRK